MRKLCRTLSGLEDALLALERRGISLRNNTSRRDTATGKLPMYHVYYGLEEHWFTSRDDLEAFVKTKEQAAGGELQVGRAEEAAAAEPAAGSATSAARLATGPGTARVAAAAAEEEEEADTTAAAAAGAAAAAAAVASGERRRRHERERLRRTDESD